MVNAKNLSWGYKLDAQCKAAWGARCFIETLLTNPPGKRAKERRTLALLPDRQDLVAVDEEARMALVVLLNGDAGIIAHLMKHVPVRVVVDECSYVESPRKGTLVHVKANGGYVYITVTLDEESDIAAALEHERKGTLVTWIPEPVDPAEGIVDGRHRVAMVRAGDKGYHWTGTHPYTGGVGETAPWAWGATLEEAKDAVRKFNEERLGISPAVAAIIVGRTMSRAMGRIP